jgi:hypothetical protein
MGGFGGGNWSGKKGEESLNSGHNREILSTKKALPIGQPLSSLENHPLVLPLNFYLLTGLTVEIDFLIALLLH